MVRLLLDTHVLLWSLTEPRKLRRETREALEDEHNDVFVSAVSGWEIAVKRALGKLRAPDDLEAGVRQQGFLPLHLTFLHAEQAGALPPHHGDPFDRMLVAQAQVEGLAIVTRDARIPLYGIRTMKA
ncbi:MAG: type II toxin-antitoxin system VapC family toxin [Acidobacteria bacterium]|nr:type II toxin-antitoxin system VapC family toxin [Acidobacteriota bacterium]MXZ70377.1 type II toxin-antitoxin system VapC family toxin [Acidobacteriota bacterium]MYD70744.1 type II toxin-antitoxin system VapC family toxin [Acidobacteriota bacterium]MYJ03476.1 type II toxin-antitoxin system VapC family toxin [Acidobacteriota bacterium]